MATILELREKRAKAWEATKAFLDTHRTEKGTLTAEDDASYTRMEQDITDLGKEINRLERDGADVVGMTGMPEAVLAREAGVSPAAPYHHFKDKGELLDAVAHAQAA